jgi:hypothetical protein
VQFSSKVPGVLSANRLKGGWFLRFGWDADSALLSDYQQELTERR